MTLRHLYQRLRKEYFDGKTGGRFPIYINLRDHWGQRDPAEVMERHARNVGFAKSNELVRAWRAGYAYLLLDGFDEVASTTLQGVWRSLKPVRFAAMEPVRRFVRDQSSEAGIVVAGRHYFFDSDGERRGALGIGEDGELRLEEFTVSQVREYLKRTRAMGPMPSWLPSRPFFVASVVATKSFPDSEEIQTQDPAEGWPWLLDILAEREARIEAGIDGLSVRRILQRLATMARTSATGLGPLSLDDMTLAFKQICGFKPDEAGTTLLLRLPGLTPGRDEGSRTFVDEDFADACRSGDLVEFVTDPYTFDSQLLTDISGACGQLAISIGVKVAQTQNVNDGQMLAATQHLQRIGATYFLSDVVRICLDGSRAFRQPITLRDLFCDYLQLSGACQSTDSLQFEECHFRVVSIDPDFDLERGPRFLNCVIVELQGRVSEKELPPGKFSGCAVEESADAAGTTNQVLQLDLPLGTKVMLTILKKLYERRGSGRRENALHRGLDHNARRLVPDILQILQSEGLAMPLARQGDTVWLPVRTERKRVGDMLSAPIHSHDPAIKRSAE